MRLYCVRHGESVYNAEGRIQGQSDVPLSDLGLRQGVAVAEALRGCGVDAVFSSPLQRASRTAELVRDELGIPLFFDDRLKEVHAGIFQDQIRRDLENSHPQELARWKSEDLDYAIPGGETRRQLMTRGREALEEIARSNHQHVAVISHGRLLVVTLKHLLGLAPKDAPVALDNGSITTLVVNDGQFNVDQWNCIDHLAHVGLAGKGDL
jgi:broad specificity phosphatase PhoE